MIDIDKLKADANGRWTDILASQGIDVGNGNHQPCPMCGGKDRFRFDNKDGTGSYICGQCGAGDGFTIIQQICGVNFIGAVEIVQGVIGQCEADKEKPLPPDARRIVKQIWAESANISGTPAEKYLKSRGLMYIPSILKYCPTCFNSEKCADLPAMIAPIQNPNGKGVALHRTYLTKNGEKANVDKVKMLTPVTEKICGGAVRLFPIEGDTLGIAEGIETATSCMQLFGVPTWAAVSSTIMEGFKPPAEARKIIIYADNDGNFTGQKSAYILANRLYQDDRIVEVLMPDNVGDFNDVLNR